MGMSVEDAVTKLIANDYSKGNVVRLNDWASQFPDHLIKIERSLENRCLMVAVESHQWRLVRYILTCDSIPFNDLQMTSITDSEHPFAMDIAQCVIQRNSKKKLSALSMLQGKVDV
jgi:hypothetical protein